MAVGVVLAVAFTGGEMIADPLGIGDTEVVGGDEDGGEADRLTSFVGSSEVTPCWLVLRLDVVVLFTDCVICVVVEGTGFMVTEPCLVCLVVPSLPFLLTSGSG